MTFEIIAAAHDGRIKSGRSAARLIRLVSGERRRSDAAEITRGPRSLSAESISIYCAKKGGRGFVEVILAASGAEVAREWPRFPFVSRPHRSGGTIDIVAKLKPPPEFSYSAAPSSPPAAARFISARPRPFPYKFSPPPFSNRSGPFGKIPAADKAGPPAPLYRRPPLYDVRGAQWPLLAPRTLAHSFLIFRGDRHRAVREKPRGHIRVGL